MHLLKPLFFRKYRPRQKFDYDARWQKVNTNYCISVLKAETETIAKGVVILAHPMFHLGKYFFVEYGHAQMYLNHGYHVYIFDFNGFGESDDRDFDFQQDLTSVIQTANEQYSSLPLALHGVSFGASQILPATLANEDIVDALIVESATSSNLEYYKGKGSKLYHLLNLYNVLFPEKNAQNLYYNLIGEIKNTPILFIYGSNDIKTPVWMGKKLYENAVTEKKFVEFDTKHLTTISEEPEAYRKEIFEFLEKPFPE